MLHAETELWLFEMVYGLRWSADSSAAVILNSFMMVPLWSASLSLLVARIEPLKHSLATQQPVDNAIANAGKCSIPLNLVVVGAYFYLPDESCPWMSRQ